MGTDSLDGSKISRKIVCAKDDFVARTDIQAPQCQFDGHGSGSTQPDVAVAGEGGELFAEALGVGAVVATPASVAVGGQKGFADGRLRWWPGGRPLWDAGRTSI